MAASPFKTLSAIALLTILGITFLQGCGKKESLKTRTPRCSMSITLTIDGMTCEHCVKTITRGLSQCPGVTSAEVFLGAKEAIVSGNDLDKEALKEVVEGKRYKVTKVE